MLYNPCLIIVSVGSQIKLHSTHFTYKPG